MIGSDFYNVFDGELNLAGVLIKTRNQVGFTDLLVMEMIIENQSDDKM